MVNLSFIICCYNSSARIRGTLSALLLALREGDFNSDVIVVDNRCQDDTVKLAEQIFGQFSFENYKILVESTPGLMAARLCGAAAADGDYFVFVDDDNELSNSWLGAFHSFVNAKGAGNVAMIGSLLSKKPGLYPAWFDEYMTSYACGDFGRTVGKLKSGELNYGACVCIRRDVWHEIQPLLIRALNFGRNGSSLGAGDDGLINELIDVHGYSRFYCPEMLALHAIPRSRLNWDYLVDLHRGFGCGSAKICIFMLKYHKCGRGKYVIRTLALMGFSVVDILRFVFMKCLNPKKFKLEGEPMQLKGARAFSTVRELFLGWGKVGEVN